MGNNIKNYRDLKEEEERLVEQLKLQKLRLQADISELKKETKPIIDVFSIAGKLTSRNNDNVVINAMVDLIIARIFSKSGLLVWLVFPTLLSNLSSHYVPRLIPVLKKLFREKVKRTGQNDTEKPPEFIPLIPHQNGHKEKVAL